MDVGERSQYEIRRTQARKISRTTHGYREAAMAAFAKSWRRE
jgi:hypothetical protein